MIYYLLGNQEEEQYLKSVYIDTQLRDFGDYFIIDTVKEEYHFIFDDETYEDLYYNLESKVEFIELEELKALIREKNIDNILKEK